MVLTNACALCKLHNSQAGKVGKAQRKFRTRASTQAKGNSARTKAVNRLCRQYVDKQGKRRFVGTRKLKSSQLLGSRIMKTFFIL